MTGKMTPARADRLGWIVFAVGMAAALIGSAEQMAAIAVGGVVIAACGFGFRLVFYRCPRCGAFLGRSGKRHCPQCGAPVTDDEAAG